MRKCRHLSNVLILRSQWTSEVCLTPILAGDTGSGRAVLSTNEISLLNTSSNQNSLSAPSHISLVVPVQTTEHFPSFRSRPLLVYQEQVKTNQFRYARPKPTLHFPPSFHENRWSYQEKHWPSRRLRTVTSSSGKAWRPSGSGCTAAKPLDRGNPRLIVEEAVFSTDKSGRTVLCRVMGCPIPVTLLPGQSLLCSS